MKATEHAQNELKNTVGRMLALLDATPDEQLLFKPSPSSRSILEIVAHSAHALHNILTQMQGIPFPEPTSAEANIGFLEHDRKFVTRQETRDYLVQNCDHYIDFLASLSEEDLKKIAKLPFGLGEVPLGYFLTAGNNHTTGHIAQIEYIQTIYGDQNWHTGF